jgi:arylsulfatase A-like enzyme
VGIGKDLTAFSNPAFTTLSEYLRSQGYQTAAFFNSPVLGRETYFDRGFEYIRESWRLVDPRGPFYSFVAYISQLFGSGKNYARKVNRAYEKRVAKPWNSGDKGGKRTLALFRRWLSVAGFEPRPLFAFVHLLEPHTPYLLPRSESPAFLSKGRIDEAEEIARRYKFPYDFLEGKVEIAKDEFELLAILYDELLRYADGIVRDILSSLSVQNLLDNTLVIVTSDHGECFGEHGWYQHSSPSLYEPAIRIPLIIRFPDAFPPGERVLTPVSIVDLFPTIAGLLGHTPAFLQEQFQGHSLVPESLAAHKDRFVIAESFGHYVDRIQELNPGADFTKYDYSMRALWWRQWKLIRRSSEFHELYSLRDDPYEMTNLWSEESDLARTLSKKMEDWLASFDPHIRNGESRVETQEDVKERLRALGYLEY